MLRLQNFTIERIRERINIYQRKCVIRKAKILIYFIMAVFIFVSLFGAFIAIIYQSIEIKIIGIINFIVGLLLVLYFRQLKLLVENINIEQDKNNIQCYKNCFILLRSILNNPDYSIVGSIFKDHIVFLSYLQIIFFRGGKINESLNIFYLSNIYESACFGIFMALFALNMLLSALLLFCYCFQLMGQIINYKKMQIDELFFPHLSHNIASEENRKILLAKTSIKYIIYAQIFLLISSGIYIFMLISMNNKYVIIYASTSIFESILFVFEFAKLISLLKVLLNQILQENNMELLSQNEFFFLHWTFLVWSLYLTRPFLMVRILNTCLDYLVFIMAILILLETGIYEIHNFDLQFLECYLYFQTSKICIIKIFDFTDFLLRCIHSDYVFSFSIQGFKFANLRNNVVAPIQVQAFQTPVESQEDQLENHQYLNQLLNSQKFARKNLEDCCICLGQIFKGDKIFQAKCHRTHVFHFSCLVEWVRLNNSCPYCKENLFDY